MSSNVNSMCEGLTYGKSACEFLEGNYNTAKGFVSGIQMPKFEMPDLSQYMPDLSGYTMPNFSQMCEENATCKAGLGFLSRNLKDLTSNQYVAGGLDFFSQNLGTIEAGAIGTLDVTAGRLAIAAAALTVAYKVLVPKAPKEFNPMIGRI